MKKNVLGGNIPTFSALYSLTDVDFSKNLLSGSLSLIGDSNTIVNIIIGSSSGDNFIVGPLPSQYCKYNKLELLSMPSSNATCYPSCLYAYLNADYNVKTDRCPGNEDIAICDFVRSTNIGLQMSRQLSQQQFLYDSPHPVPYLFQSSITVSEPNVNYYQIQLDARCFLPANTFIKICYDVDSCISLVCRNQSSLFKNPLEIRSPSFNISFVMNVDGTYYGYELIVNAFISNNGWACASSPHSAKTITCGSLRKLSIPNFSYAPGVCSWYGIKCNKGQIVDISLTNFNIKGVLTKSLNLISTLQVLSLSSNSLKGQIPSSLGDLPNLRTLDLSSNLLNGTIPPEIMAIKTLVTLSLAKNKLSGMITTNISSSVKTVILSNNLLDGQIPTEIGKLSASTLFDFQGNSGITCYQPTPGSNPQLGILNECVPTSSPTLFPTLTTSSGSNNTSTIIIASAVSAAGLCFLIVFGVIYFRNRNKYRSLKADQN